MRDLHDRLFVADLHSDALLWNRDLLAWSSRGHVDVPRLAYGNVALQVFSVTTKLPLPRRADGVDLITLLGLLQRRPWPFIRDLKQRAVLQARALTALTERSGGQLVLLTRAVDVDAFMRMRSARPRIAASVLSLEGGHAFGEDVGGVQELFDEGFRIFGLVHTFDNALGGSSLGATRSGLTPFGRQVLVALERLGAIVDLAHASEAVVDEVLASYRGPVIVTHTGVKATCPDERNLGDEHIRTLAQRGGLIGIGLWERAVCGATVDDTVRAIRHVVRTIDAGPAASGGSRGVDVVALGSDFDGAVGAAVDATGLVMVTDALRRAGFSDAEVAKVMGDNVARFLRRSLPR